MLGVLKVKGQSEDEEWRVYRRRRDYMNHSMGKSWVVISLAIITICGSALGEQLKWAMIISRHGARSPLTAFQPLSHRVTWPYGYGELTPSGARQLYLLGRMFRQYYVEELHFLNSHYNESEMYVRSTDFHRTLMTGHSFLLGLYPEGLNTLTPKQLQDESIWTPPMPLTIPENVKKNLGNSSLPFNVPVLPIMNYDQHLDRMLLFNSCPRYIQIRSLFYLSEKAEELFKKHLPTLLAACSVVKIDCEHIPPTQVFLVVDYLLAAEFDGQLEELGARQDLVQGLMRFYADMVTGEMSFKPWMNSVVMHELAAKLTKYMDTVIHKPAEAQKLIVYLTHDSTVIGYLLGFESKTPHIFDFIPFAAHIVIELTKRDDAQDGDESAYTVNATYDGLPILPPTPYSKFIEQINRVGKLPESWEQFCDPKHPEMQLRTPEAPTSNLIILYQVLLSVVIVVLLGFAIKTIVTKCRRKTVELSQPVLAAEPSSPIDQLVVPIQVSAIHSTF